MTIMASAHTVPTVLALFSLAAMLATGCGSKGLTGDTGAKDGTTRQGSGGCLDDYGEYSGCLTWYGRLDMPDNVASCEESGGEWIDEACPVGFEARCNAEFAPGSGFEIYFYDMSEKANHSNQLLCDAAGGIWHE
jgi:hypothetical protein